MMKLVRRILLPLLFASSALAQTPTCSIEWHPALRITSDSVFSTTPQIAVSGDTVHLIWYSFDLFGIGRYGIQYARSTDGGATFTAQVTLASIDTASNPGYVGAIGANVFIAFAGTIDTATGTFLLRSTDAGASWLPPALVRSRNVPLFLHCDSTTAYIVFRDPSIPRFGIVRSTDTGGSWRTMSTNAPEITSLASAGERLHAVGTLGSNLKDVFYYQSPSGGASWGFPEMLSGDDFTTANAPRIASNGRNEIYCVWTEASSILMRRSRNLGDSWFTAEILSADSGTIFTDVAAGSEFVAAVWDNDFGGVRDVHVRSSNDYGRSFCPIDSASGGGNAGEPAVRIWGHTAHTAWVEDIGGALEIVYRGGTLTDNPDLIERPPKEFALRQNYPNPFNGTTHIPFDLPRGGHVKLTVYSVLGQKVATLVDADLAAGRPDILFDAGMHPSGMYIYRLQTPDFTETRTMLLVR